MGIITQLPKSTSVPSIWLISRVDQASILAQHLAAQKRLVRWDSFWRHDGTGLVQPQSRNVDTALCDIPGRHLLPDLLVTNRILWVYRSSTRYNCHILHYHMLALLQLDLDFHATFLEEFLIRQASQLFDHLLSRKPYLHSVIGEINQSSF